MLLLELLRPEPAARRIPKEPAKGDYNALCQRLACDNAGAHWFNTTNGRYYCSSCARTFNEVLRLQGRPAMCELHLSR
jgi:hypothetical protein